MNIPLVIIESKIGIAISVKQALEQTGQFHVFPFADAFAALEYLDGHRVQVVVIDLHMPEYPGVSLIEAIRQKQPDVLIYASTSDSRLAVQAAGMNITGLLDGNYNARQVLENLEKVMPELTTDNSVMVEPPSRLESVENKADADELFKRLADEEPPRPNAKQGGTITNFMQRVTDDELNNLLTSLSEVIDIPDEPFPVDEIDDPAVTESDTPAQFILEDITEDTMPFEASPFEAYIEKLRGSVPINADDEPDFLDGADELFEADQLTQTTKPSTAELERIERDKQHPETVTIAGEPVMEEPAPVDEPETDEPEQEVEPEPQQVAPTAPEDDPQVLERLDDDVEDSIWDWGDADFDERPDDPRVAQMALSLTKVSLESTTQATLLIEDGEIIATDGNLDDDDVGAVLQVVLESQDTIKAHSGRVRFIELPSNSQDALVYSRRTDQGYIITMVFPGDTTMTDMRVQAKRLVEALESVPQMPPEDVAQLPIEEEPEDEPSKGGLRLEVAAPVDVGPLTRYTFVWLPGDPNYQIEYPVAEAIDSGLRIQLGERGWHIEELEVEEDYVYLVAGIPGEEPPQSIVRNLQKRSAKIARTQSASIDPDVIWADSYFTLAPGRKLNLQEIQQFINFSRM